MAVRPEDKDASQDQRAFADGATLAELEEYIAFLRSLGAPGDAHPKVGANDNYEVTMMICVVERSADRFPPCRLWTAANSPFAGCGSRRTGS